MFETNDEGRLPLFSRQGKHLWTYVSVRLQNPWFHVQYAAIDESGDRFTKTIFLSEIDHLVEMSQRENVRLEYVDLVSPEHVNGSNRWKMEPLQQILRHQIEKTQNWLGYVFVLENGSQYTYPDHPPEDANCTSQLIFEYGKVRRYNA